MYIKKLMIIMLAATMLCTLPGCGKKEPTPGNTGGDTNIGELFQDILNGKRGDGVVGE